MTYDLATAVAGAHAAREYMSQYKMRWSWTNAVVVDRALDRGLQVDATPRRRIRISDGSRSQWFSGGHTDINDRLADRLTRFKEVTNNLLRSRGLFAPESAIFQAGDGQRAWRWGQHLAPLVLKPSNSNQGKMVHVGLTDRAEFLDAFDLIARKHGGALVEQFVPGVEHRVAVVDNQVVAATRRVPANVVGDGVSTVSELVAAKNEARRDASNLIHQHLRIDATAQRELARQDFDDASVPPEGQRVFLRATSNIHTGGDAIDATDELSEEEVAFVERAARTFRGLRLAGFDVLLPRDGVGVEPCVLEINTGLMLSMHHFPAEGQPRDVAGRLIDAMFPATRA